MCYRNAPRAEADIFRSPLPRCFPEVTMGKYSVDPDKDSKSCKARGSNIRVHYKVRGAFPLSPCEMSCLCFRAAVILVRNDVLLFSSSFFVVRIFPTSFARVHVHAVVTPTLSLRMPQHSDDRRMRRAPFSCASPPSFFCSSSLSSLSIPPSSCIPDNPPLPSPSSCLRVHHIISAASPRLTRQPATLFLHAQNTREVVGAVRGMHLRRALSYLDNVMAKKEIIPYRRYKGDVGRHAQAKQFKTVQGRWPVKSCEFIASLLKNAESNADTKGLDVDSLIIEHAQCNRAARMRRRTYRAHGRINPYQSAPCHVEFILTESDEVVSRPEDEAGRKKVSKKKIARERRDRRD